MHHRFLTGQRDEILGWIPEATESVTQALDRLKSLLDPLREEVEHLGNFPSLFLGTVSPDGGLEFYEGVLFRHSKTQLMSKVK